VTAWRVCQHRMARATSWNSANAPPRFVTATTNAAADCTTIGSDCPANNSTIDPRCSRGTATNSADAAGSTRSTSSNCSTPTITSAALAVVATTIAVTLHAALYRCILQHDMLERLARSVHSRSLEIATIAVTVAVECIYFASP
jgi:hypothetical protein